MEGERKENLQCCHHPCHTLELLPLLSLRPQYLHTHGNMHCVPFQLIGYEDFLSLSWDQLSGPHKIRDHLNLRGSVCTHVTCTSNVCAVAIYTWNCGQNLLVIPSHTTGLLQQTWIFPWSLSSYSVLVLVLLLSHWTKYMHVCIRTCTLCTAEQLQLYASLDT